MICQCVCLMGGTLVRLANHLQATLAQKWSRYHQVGKVSISYRGFALSKTSVSYKVDGHWGPRRRSGMNHS